MTEQDVPAIDFLIVTALEEERDVVLSKLPKPQKLPPSAEDVRVYFLSILPVTFSNGKTGSYRVVVMPLLSMGRVQATVATGDAIRQWHPRYVILVGIAGGISRRNQKKGGKKGVRLGDILVADQIVDYELQKLTPEGPEIRWQVYRADPRLVGAARNFGSAGCQQLVTAKRPDAGTPRLHMGPIASGDKVIAFDEVLSKHRDQWSLLIGVEMEAAGVAAAAFQAAQRPGFFMVRGVSDLADKRKGSASVDRWRPYACDIAASYAIALLRSGPVVPSPPVEHEATPFVGKLEEELRMNDEYWQESGFRVPTWDDSFTTAYFLQQANQVLELSNELDSLRDNLRSASLGSGPLVRSLDGILTQIQDQSDQVRRVIKTGPQYTMSITAEKSASQVLKQVEETRSALTRTALSTAGGRGTPAQRRVQMATLVHTLGLSLGELQKHLRQIGRDAWSVSVSLN